MKAILPILILVSFLFVENPVKAQGYNDTPVDVSTIASTDMPVVTPYFLQHQYLSVIASSVKENEGEVFETPYILNTLSAIGNGFKSPFEDKDIQVERIDDEGRAIYVWKFPESEYLREALYMAFIPIDGCYKAFAISRGQMVDWEISTSSDISRSTFGQVKKPDSAKECVELLKSRGAYTGNITPGNFFQDGYSGPSYRPQK